MKQDRFNFETLIVYLSIGCPVLGFIIGISWAIFGSEEKEDAFFSIIGWIQGFIFVIIVLISILKFIFYDDENDTFNSFSQIIKNIGIVIYGAIVFPIGIGLVISFWYFIIMLIPSLVSNNRSFTGLVTDIYEAWETVILNIWHWIF